MRNKSEIYHPVAPQSGSLLSELPEPFQSKFKKEYFDRSPWAIVIALENGKFLVQKIPTLTYIPAHSWAEAISIREGLVSSYNEINRCFL